MTKGFVFLELLYVVVILGILSAIAVPAYQDYIYRLNIAEGLVVIQPVQQYIEEYYAHTGRFPDTLENEDSTLPNHFATKRLVDINIVQGAIQMRYRGSAIGKQSPAYLTLRPVVDVTQYSRPIRWLCGNKQEVSPDLVVIGENMTDLDNRHLPAECRN
jgi:type IV pilus assembly protein PilA